MRVTYQARAAKRDVRMPHAYRYDPGPQATVTFMESPVAFDRRFDTCPRCGWPMEHEPAMMHCRGCGRMFPVAGEHLYAQRLFEQSSGLVAEYATVE